MNSFSLTKFACSHLGIQRPTLAYSGLLFCAAVLPLQAAAEVLYQTSDTEIRWDNTIKYSTGVRLKDSSREVLAAGAGPNGDDGDLNFRKGRQFSNRLDLLSEFDFSRNDFGVRVSAAAWYDEVYSRKPTLQDNPNFPFPTNNSGRDDFFSETKKLQGNYAEVLDAFVYGTFFLGSVPTTLRLGQHSLVWGESLFMASNGIAATMSPLNIAKGASVPNTPAKELFLPVRQFSFSTELSPNVGVEGYWQFEWDGSRLPGAGSYFSDVDIYGPGGDNLLSPPEVPLWAPLTALRRSDRNPSDSGQYGLALRYRSEVLDTDFGFFAIRYHDKVSPVNFYMQPSGAPIGCSITTPSGCAVPLFASGEYGFLYGEGVKLYGLSASTSVGDWNVAGELSLRKDEALRSNIAALTAPDSGLLARGDTVHYQLSAIRAFADSPLWNAATLVVEAGGHRLQHISKNRENFDSASTTDSAFGFRGVFTANYFQVVSGLDVELPIGLGYSTQGRSPIDNKFNNGGAHKGGDLSLGLNFNYRNTWKAGVGYTTYFGAVDDGQMFKDRDFISLFVQTTL
ncbi:MAG: DUF1302 domain-containing protein [Pseudomonas sp.]|nr:DUF1302 domain-containing protein [Pseudomonas sp.]